MKRLLAMAILIVFFICALGSMEEGADFSRYSVLTELNAKAAPSSARDEPGKALSLPENTAEPSPDRGSEPTGRPGPSSKPDVTPAPSPKTSPEPTIEPSAAPDVDTSPQPTAEPEPADDWSGSTGLDPTEGYDYYIKVNYLANTVTVYAKGESGQFDTPVRAMICSSGSATPRSGVFRPGWRLTWQNLFYGVYGQYVTQITGNILFHSVPYQIKYDKSSLEYWEFDKLGTAASAGCIRLQVIDAKWIYDNFHSIYAVEFYGDSDPGPLGKPEAPTISDDELRRGWDPTDPDGNNLWNMTDEEIYEKYPWLDPSNPPTPTPAPPPEPTPEPET